MRNIALSLLTACAALAGGHALAQTADKWPSKPITLIVPYAAGSSIDVFTRAMGQELNSRLATPVIVENVNGAGGAVATLKGVQSRPDGYTFVMGVESTVLLAQLVRPVSIKYDGLKDLAPVVKIASSTLVVVGKPALPANTSAELFAALRADPKGLSYGTTGVGTSLHLAGEMISQEAKVPLLHVPYSVSTQITTDVAGNQLDLAIMPVGAVLPFIKACKFKAYAVTSAQRFPALPDTPALAELPGLRSLDVSTWWGLFAPAGTPAAINGAMAREVLALLESPALKQRALDLGVKLTPMPAEGFARELQSDMVRYSRLVQERRLQAE